MSGWRPLIKSYFAALRLRESFERHLAETRNHVRRIERVFEMHGIERRYPSLPSYRWNY
jgi:ferritin-like metal-binding protein YciE